ncbi:dihydrofolate reductase family protein [Mucilaginibacter sp. UR6-11]|uniref:dihydrofolate reductase family protein n=1 Tax=Mucilaginibacter sp. UR6-11 TaxID=1435644 RepID=UPI001E5D2244|nr:dihydrofolate reductase family protein [Mucilaginibacter sp. UR6-11]MCC8424923.1 dihydrofolate reductase family protein [Mucilaginibacter sp. UR6-11]
MRKLIVISMISLDGVMQGPGGPEEDTSGGFEFGGWVAPFGDEAYDKAIKEQMKAADLLLGRKTFDIWEPYWPAHADFWPGINEMTKYVLSTTRNHSNWQNVVFISSLDDIKKLKVSAGSDIRIWGSSELVQLLLQHDLVDELWLKIHPLLLGKGKKIFGDDAFPRSLTLTDSTVTSKGVIMANYRRNGEVKTGRAGADDKGL